MRATTYQILLSALRDRLLTTLLIAIAGTVLLSSFLGEQSLVERDETALAFAGFSIRLIVVAGMALFAIVSLHRSFESGEMILQLSRPVSRSRYILANFMGFWLVALGLIVAATGLIGVITHAALPSLILWAVALAAETAVVLAFALFAILGLETIVGAFALTAAFYVLTRLTGILLSLATSEFRNRPSHFEVMIDWLSRALGVILPRLDRFNSDWLMHLPQINMACLLMMQITAYTGLLLTAASFDFTRRRF